MHILQYGLPMPLALLRADNNLPPWRLGLKEVIFLRVLVIIFAINFVQSVKGTLLVVYLDSQVWNFINISNFAAVFFFFLFI